ncbi:hypothetical protein [Brasilonema sp. UFV-L1]|uniref:hypothetical protein n=1 Tax=Brasilonema sp. UFV-L1 TaxID=2234130 RepID=UPI00145FCC1C|nr:hypothetical protein [Brasilonema sp. UFV-L1]NMG06175.1 hypothetical protein [Brasilonema sp. UFV-L1]
MIKKTSSTIVIIAVLASFISGCRSSAEYQRLAKAGNTYTTAMDKLLTTASQIKINTTSEQLLKDDRLSNQTFEGYNELSKLDVERLEILQNLRKHNRLLTRYFTLIDELATSNAPEKAQQEIGGVVDNLNKIGTQLRGSALVSNTSVIKSVGGLVISSQIRGALREELEKRKDVIDLEFQTQQVLLKALSDSIKQDVNLTRESRELRQVIRPLIAEKPISDADNWIDRRRKILTMNTTVSELEEASDSAKTFRDLFKDFVEGKLNRERLNTLLTDIESFLTIVEQLKNE